jgi:hypothetical protein
MRRTLLFVCLPLLVVALNIAVPAYADAGDQMRNCISGLPSTGGTCDMRSLTGAQSINSTVTLGSPTRPVELLLGAATFSCSASTACFSVPGNSSAPSGSRLIGLSKLGTTINYTGTGADCIQVTGSNAGVEELNCSGGPGTRHGISLITSTLTVEISHGTFRDLAFHGQVSPNADVSGIHLSATRGSDTKVAFNLFINVDVTDYDNSVTVTFNSGGSPYSALFNQFIGGQFRKTSATPTGNCFNLASSSNTQVFGSHCSDNAVGYNLLSTVQNEVFAAVLESNSLDVQIDEQSADNHFIGTNFQTLVDSAVRTLILSTNNGFSGGMAASKTGVPVILGAVSAGSLSVAAAPGTILYCPDCKVQAACVTGGNGALAKRFLGGWVCN